MFEPSRSIGLGVLLGLLLMALGASHISVVTSRQALILAGFSEAQNGSIELGSVIVVDSNGAFEIIRPEDICASVPDFQAEDLFEKFPDQKFEVSTALSSRYWPWEDTVTFTLSDVTTVQPGRLLSSLFDQSDQCEAELGERAKRKCLLVVRELAKASGGFNVMRLSGCQLVYAEDNYVMAAELGSAQRYRDLFAKISKLERIWISFKEAFVRISASDVQ